MNAACEVPYGAGPSLFPIVSLKSVNLFLAPPKASVKIPVSDFSPIKITEEMDFKVWGVVTYIIHKAL